MKEIKIKQNDFNFARFVKKVASFIDDNFGSDSPGGTMQYFHSFSRAVDDSDDPILKDIERKLKPLLEKYHSGELEKNKKEFFQYMELLQEQTLRKDEVQVELQQKKNASKNGKSFTEKDEEDWEMDDFKAAVLKGGETIFFPFTSGMDEDGFLILASGGTIILARDNEDEEWPSIGMTDCFGILVNLTDKKFVFNSAIAWGDMASSIEYADHPVIDAKMKYFIESFRNKPGKAPAKNKTIKKCKKRA